MTRPVRNFLGLALVFATAGAGAAQNRPEQKLARQVLEQLIDTNTTDSSGDVTRAAEEMAERFRSAGFPTSDVHVLAPEPHRGNLVVRFRGAPSSLKPLLFLGHLDVVEARREDWSFDPFQLLEKDGYFYGRGTQDMKSDDALLVTTFLRLKQEGFVPVRDLILALTAGEESGAANGVEWLLREHRDLIDADYAINADAGGGVLRNGRHWYMGVQAAEKVYASFRLDVHNRGGHSSLPTPDNAVYRLADALERLRKLEFPVRLNPVSRSYFERMARISSGELAADMRAVAKSPPDAGAVERLSREPYYNAVLRTTCIPTELKGGHAENALPQLAEAVVNCRLVPDDSSEAVQSAIVRAVADPQVSVTAVAPAVAGPSSPLRVDVLNAVTKAAESVWGPVPIVPLMETGATDGKYLRLAGIPVYGVSAIFIDMDDVRAHGRDERVRVQSFYDGLRFDYDLIRNLAGPNHGPLR